MKGLMIVVCLIVSANVFANQYCMTYPDGTVICSNPDGSWGR